MAVLENVKEESKLMCLSISFNSLRHVHGGAERSIIFSTCMLRVSLDMLKL